MAPVCGPSTVAGLSINPAPVIWKSHANERLFIIIAILYAVCGLALWLCARRLQPSRIDRDRDRCAGTA